MNNIDFSLIMATYGREKEIALFLDSILAQEFPLKKIELIIIDQNDKIDLKAIIDEYKTQLNIIYIQSDKKGLSLNRNIGLKYAKGKYIAFPDDDCTYYPETLNQAWNLFQENPNIDVFLGKIIDKSLNKNIIRNWKNNTFLIHKFNFFLNYSSITIFTKKNDILFDEQLGVGTYFGSYEDAEYVFNLISTNRRVYYTPKIEVWHPEPKEQELNYNKIYSYGLGFGALIVKHFSLPMISLFIQSIAFHIIKLILSLARFDRVNIKKSWFSIASRFKGAYKYATK